MVWRGFIVIVCFIMMGGWMMFCSMVLNWGVVLFSCVIGGVVGWIICGLVLVFIWCVICIIVICLVWC